MKSAKPCAAGGTTDGGAAALRGQIYYKAGEREGPGMPWRWTHWVGTGITITVFVAGSVAADTARLEYDREVRPILSDNCFPCHGQDSKKRMAGLRLDTFEGATAARSGHAALTPGRAESSAVYQRITAVNPAQKMPPAYSNHRLTAE